MAALRFLYQVTLKRDWAVEALPLPKRGDTLPVVLSPEEVVRFLDGVARPKHRMILTTCYAAGLRLGEALRLKVTNVDSGRMVLQVEQGKGARDRYVMLSPTLLQQLRTWWRIERPARWLFPGRNPEQPMQKGAVQWACRLARYRSRLAKPVTPHSLRHAFAVHLLEVGTDVRTIQLLLGHRRLETTARYLRLATTKVCSATSPLDLLPRPETASVSTRSPGVTVARPVLRMAEVFRRYGDVYRARAGAAYDHARDGLHGRTGPPAAAVPRLPIPHRDDRVQPRPAGAESVNAHVDQRVPADRTAESWDFRASDAGSS